MCQPLGCVLDHSEGKMDKILALRKFTLCGVVGWGVGKDNTHKREHGTSKVQKQDNFRWLYMPQRTNLQVIGFRETG